MDIGEIDIEENVDVEDRLIDDSSVAAAAERSVKTPTK